MPDDEDFIEFLVDSADALGPDDARELDDDLDEPATTGDEDEEPRLLAEIEEEPVDPVASALQPGAPLLVIHKSHQHANILPSIIDDIDRRHNGTLHLGVAASMPRTSPSVLSRFLAQTAKAPVRIADPEAFARMDSFGTELSAQREGKPFVGPSTARHWAYITEQQPSGYTTGWVADVLDAQRQAGATVLLTPGVWSDPANPAAALATMREHVSWAHDHCIAGDHLGVNLTLPASWLTTRTLRDRLLNELIDMDDQVYYLRVRWPLIGQPYGQLLESNILDGYAEIASTLDDNDRVLILPNTGLTGWLSLAWGAHGFSTGIGSAERAFADTRVIKIKRSNDVRPAPTRRTFSEQILHVTEAPIGEQLDRLRGARCRCRYCRALRRLPDGQWDKALAGGHYLTRIADLTARLAIHSRGRQSAARRMVRDAVQLVAESARILPLQGANDPKHLPLWADWLR